MSVPMASAEQLERWKAIGGQVEETATKKKGAKKDVPSVFISPSGVKLQSWNDAAKVLAEADCKSDAGAGAKRGKENDKSGKEPTGAKAKKAKTDKELKEQPAQDDGKDKSNKRKAGDAVVKPAGKADDRAQPEAKGDKASKKAVKSDGKADIKPEPSDADEKAAVGSGRQAAQGKSYKEGGRQSFKSEMVDIKEEEAADTEAAAIEQTAGITKSAKRRFTQFCFEDSEGQVVPIDRIMIASGPVTASGCIYPDEASVAKKDAGRKVEKFGPVKDWKIAYSAAGATVQVKTSLALYELAKPGPRYRKAFADFQEQLEIVKTVYSALCPEVGGQITTSLDEVVAKMARNKIGRSYGSSRDALLLNGKFVLSQLKTMSEQHRSSKDLVFEDSEFGIALAAEVAKGPMVANVMTNGIKIINNTDSAAAATAAEGPKDAMMEADEEFARKLAAKLAAKEYGRAGGPTPKGTPYIRINLEEIADDYPLPTQYEKTEEETDEMLLFDEEMMDCDPEDLPRRLLHNFAIYNSEGFFSTLELVPMWSGVDHDVEIFASGVVTEDEGDWASGSKDSPAKADAGSSGSGSAGGTAGAASTEPQGMRLYLSQIKEWVVEAGCDQLSISIRTDVAWYRLVSPVAKYEKFFNPVLKTARLAIFILGLLSSEARASRLSFADVMRRVVEQADTDPSFISSKVDRVERFAVVHGQIILNQFKHFPNKAVQNAAFVKELKAKMEMRKHSKLYMAKVKGAKVKGVRNANPMRNRAAVGLKARPMPATSTTLVKAVWMSYFFGCKRPEEHEAAAAEATAKETEEDANEEDKEEKDDVEDALTKGAKKAARPMAPKKSTKKVKAAFVGGEINTDSEGRTLFNSAKVGDIDVSLGDLVSLAPDEDVMEEEDELPPLGLVTALFKDSDGDATVQVRAMLRSSETVLGDAGLNWELYVTEDLEEAPLSSVNGKFSSHYRNRMWSLDTAINVRRKHFQEDLDFRKRQEEAVEAGKEVEYMYRHLYVPSRGMFCAVPKEMLAIDGSYVEPKPEPVELAASDDCKTLTVNDVQYKLGDFMYLEPYAFTKDPAAKKKKPRRKGSDDEDDSEEEEAPEEQSNVPAYAKKSGKHKGSNAGLKAFAVVQLTGIVASKVKGELVPSDIKVRRFYRPEDVSKDIAYSAEWWELYSGPDTEETVPVEKVVGKCHIKLGGKPGGTSFQNVFVCTGSYNPTKPGVVGEAPKTLKLKAGKGKAAAADKAAEGPEEQDEPRGLEMKCMDIFAGCGGLSEGMHQAGVAVSRWGVEYEPSAAEAYKLNNPDAKTFCNNCNVLLRAAMEKADVADDCNACDDAMEAAAQMSAEDRTNLPSPGEVEFIMGGPPCQGYSGMNRFNKGNWSLVQNSMVMSYLSYCDFYRPRYFLLENVRNFVSHNKSFTFRLTVCTLLEMGYQVRFGVLNAGNYGVPQSRKRTIIWAAAPGETLPEWPKPLHIFHSPQLTINLPGGVQYTAVPQQVGAPLRAVTVKDAIFDLPHIVNGQMDDEMPYAQTATSAYQRFIRGNNPVLKDHICKEMNELNLERCRCIPKGQPGADWRVLQEIVKADPSREKYKGQDLVPWCLPNTADRHNGWRGLYGRLDPDGHFPTSTTDPQPMGKVGQVFHPTQDRIVSVRECARSQGFPDTFRFYGNVHCRHRQVGNAVPPPLARALGLQLRSVLNEKRKKEESAFDAQFGL